VTGKDDGSIRACLWRGAPTQAILASHCQDIAGGAKASVTADPPCVPQQIIRKTTNATAADRPRDDITCPPLYLTVGGADSYNHCYGKFLKLQETHYETK